MADVRREVELDFEHVDQQTPSPGERAKYIWTQFRLEHPELTDWDVLCFSTEYTAYQSAQWLWLREIAREMSRLVYTAHYYAHQHGIDLSTGLPDGSWGSDQEPHVRHRSEGVSSGSSLSRSTDDERDPLAILAVQLPPSERPTPKETTEREARDGRRSDLGRNARSDHG